MTSNLRNYLKDLLVKNAGEVLQKLKQVYVHNTEHYNLVIQQMAKLESLTKSRIKGTVSDEIYNIQLSDIQEGIFYLIDNITPDEAAAYELENAIFKRILVVCKSVDREELMRKLFPLDVYKGTEFDISGAPRPAASVNKFEIVVFDNEPPAGPDDDNALLRHYLDNTEPYLLYFGAKFLPLLGDYPAKAYFSNSIFSLHARLDEMITYLKYFERKG